MKIFDNGTFRELNADDKFYKIYELIKKIRSQINTPAENKTEGGD